MASSLRRGPLAVLTNKPLGPSIGILEALGLRGFFTRIIGGDSEYGRKPDPAGLLALQALAPGDRLVMIGDSPADWKAAEAANVPFVFARYGFGAAKFGAAPPDTPLVIDHARELESACSQRITRLADQQLRRGARADRHALIVAGPSGERCRTPRRVPRLRSSVPASGDGFR